MIKAVAFDCFGVVLDIMRGTKIEQTIELIHELKGHYKLAMVTNAPSRYSLDQRFKPGELDELFDVVVISGEVGWDKPAPEIYAMTVEKLAVNADECLFIDDVPAFTEAAAESGMETFTYLNVPESIAGIKAMLGGK
jgi:putative hydrolase of the HAD superfamily